MAEFKSEPIAISIAECCRRLSVGESTLRAMLDDGRLPYSRIAGAPGKRGRVVIKVADLSKLLDDSRGPRPRPGARIPNAPKPRRRAVR